MQKEQNTPWGSAIPDSLAKWISWLSISLFVATTATALLTPIYPDEYGYQLNYSRAIFDNFTISSYFPQCKSSFGIPIPILWYPARLFYWLLYSPIENARFFRIIGVAIYLAMVFSIVPLLWKALKGRVSKVSIFTSVTAFLTLGVMPSVFSFNRPEPILAACIAWFSFGPLIAHQTNTRLKSAAIFFLHTIVASFFFASHGKAIIFCPLFFASTFLLVRQLGGSKKVATLATALFIVPVLSSYTTFKAFSACPESRIVAAINSTQYLVPDKSMVENPGILANTIFTNVITAIPALEQNLFKPEYPIMWLPKFRTNLFTQSVNLFAIISYYTLANGILLFCLYGGYTAYKDRKISPSIVLLLALTQGILALFAVQTAKHFYESALTIPCLIVAVGLIATKLIDSKKDIATYIRPAHICLLTISIISSIIFSAKLFPKYLKGFSGPSISITRYDHTKTKREMLAAADACGIRNDSSVSHLVVDDLSYLFFKKTFQPYNASYLAWATTEIRGGEIVNDNSIFKDISAVDAGGIIQRCTYMDMIPAWGRNSVRIGDTCCISKATIDKLGEQFE